MSRKRVEDSRHNHTDLVTTWMDLISNLMSRDITTDNDEDDREVLPSDPARCWGRYKVPQEEAEEEDEAQEMGPDVQSLIVKTDN